MAVQLQRFCPFCDRSFLQGEAVLRCDGCGVMHHPGCWVTNGGCSTQSTHKSTPIAQAYGGARPVGAEAPHPGEGTRVAAPPPRPVVNVERERRIPPLEQLEPEQPEEDEEPVIGGDNWPPKQAAPRFVHRTLPAEATQTPMPPRRYVPPTIERSGSSRPLPRIYGGNPWLRYWYVPVAAALAIGVALIVIWVASLFGGGGSDDKATTTVTGGGATTQAASGGGASATTAPGGAATTTTVPSGTSTKFKVGDTVVVTGTGDCLNVRTEPGRTNPEGTVNPAIVCLNDSEVVTITGGPESAGDLQWWKVKTKLGEGWAAEDYLAKQ